MTTKQIHLAEMKRKMRINQEVRRGLACVLSFLAVALVILVFGIGQAYWPAWLIEYRTSVTGMVLVAFAFLTLMSPVMVEASVNPRTLHVLS